jgi:hypothetical protein
MTISHSSANPAVCLIIQTFTTCDLPEMLFLGIIYWLSCLLSILLLFHHLRERKRQQQSPSQSLETICFWIVLSSWQFFRGLIRIFYFNWDALTYQLISMGLSHILMFTAMCLMILILFNLLFAYRNPGEEAKFFFRSIFLIFFGTFIIVCIVMALSITDLTKTTTLEDIHGDRNLGLWVGATDFVIAIFFALPALQLIKAVTFPVVQPEDKQCVMASKVGLWLFVAVFIGRMLWNVSHYYHGNVAEEFIGNKENWMAGAKGGWVRVINFMFLMVFDIIPSLLVQIAVFMFDKHWLLFNQNPVYNPIRH